MSDFFLHLATAASALLLAIFPHAPAAGGGTGTLTQINPWVVSANTIKVSSTTAVLRVPGLASLGCIGTDGAGVFGAGSCSGGAGGSGVATTSLKASYPITISSAVSGITYGFAGLSTTSPWTIGNLAYVADGNHVTSVATGTLQASTGITVTAGASVISPGTVTIAGVNAIANSATKGVATYTTNDFNDNGSGLISLDYANGQAASASLNGFMAQTDWQLLHAATSTFTSPLIYTLSTNAVTLQAASASQAGSMAAVDWQRLYTATTTFTSPLIYTSTTNAVTCQVATASVPGCLAAADFTIFNAKSSFGFPWTLKTVVAQTSTYSTSSLATTTSVWSLGFFFASSTLAASQFPYASTTMIESAFASTTSMTIGNIQNAIALAGATGLIGKYGGASACAANNFVTALSAIGGTTCGTGTISGVNIGSNLNSLSVSGSITGTSFNGSAAVSDWTLNMANANSWTAVQTMKTATTTNLQASGFFAVPTTAALPTPVVVNQIAVNTTSASSSIQVGPFSVFASTTMKFAYINTPTNGVATATVPSVDFRAYTITGAYVFAFPTGGTNATVQCGNGVSSTTYLVASTTPKAIGFSKLTPFSVQSGQPFYCDIGSFTSNATTSISVGFVRSYDY